jgi:hypothetical protein
MRVGNEGKGSSTSIPTENSGTQLLVVTPKLTRLRERARRLRRDIAQASGEQESGRRVLVSAVDTTTQSQAENRRRQEQCAHAQEELQRLSTDHRGEVRLHTERLLGLARQQREQMQRAQEEEARHTAEDRRAQQEAEGQLQAEVEEMREMLAQRDSRGATRTQFAAKEEQRRQAFVGELTARAEAALEREAQRYAEADRQGVARAAASTQGLAVMGEWSTVELVRQHAETLAQARRHYAAAVAPRDQGVQLLVEQRELLRRAVTEGDAGVLQASRRGQARQEEHRAARAGLRAWQERLSHKQGEREHLQKLQGAALLLEERLRRLRTQATAYTRAVGAAQQDRDGRERRLEAWAGELERHCDTTTRQLEEHTVTVQEQLSALGLAQGGPHAPPA